MVALTRYRYALLFIALLLLLAPAAHAGMSSDQLTDAVRDKFRSACERWQQPVQAEALAIFWKLSVISLAVSLALLVVSGCFELGALMVELIRWILFVGFWSWVLSDAPGFFQGIVRSLWQLGGQASGTPDGLAVSKIIDLGMRVYQMDAGQSSLLDLGHSFLACGAGLLALVLAAVMAANVMLVLCGAWVTAYAGAIVVGLASRWTVDLPVAYLRAALAYGLRAMTLQLIMSLGLDFLNGIISQSSNQIADIGVTFLAMVILAVLATVLPWQVGHLAGGGGFFGGALGFSSVWMASQIAGRVVEQMSARGGASGGGSSGRSSAVDAVRDAANAHNGLSSVEQAAARAERYRAEGIRPNRNGGNKS